MKLNKIALAAMAVASTGAFAVTPTACVETTALDMLKTCAPKVTFYAAGATAMKGAIQSVLAGTVDVATNKVFDRTRNFVTITTGLSGDMYAYYGYGAVGTSFAGERIAVIVNGKNGSMAGVNQLLTGLKSGSIEAAVDQKEMYTIKLLSAAEVKAAGTIADTDITVDAASTTKNAVVKLAGTFTLSTLDTTGRVANFNTAWGIDKQKVAHMAFSDVRPSEATPGQIAKWDPKAFPAETIAMQGFGVVVNNAMYNALQAREIREGRLDSTCVAGNTTALCQPSVSTADMTALITGKTQSAAAFLRTTTDAVLNLNRRPASSGTQASTQIRFAGEANYVGKTPIAGTAAFDMIGDEVSGGAAVSLNGGLMTVKTHSGTGGLLAQVGMDTGLSIGVASLDNAAASKFGTPGLVSGSTTSYEGKPISGTSPQTMRWVKVDGISPDSDAKQRVGLLNGYSFAMEFQTLKSSKLAGVYDAIYSNIVAGLKDPAANLTGIAYIGSTDATKNTAWTRGGNNFFPLNKY